jgi:hypothetical protein
MNLQPSLNPIQIVYQSVRNLRVHVSQSLLEFDSQNLFGVGYSIIWKVSSGFFRFFDSRRTEKGLCVMCARDSATSGHRGRLISL